MSRFFPQPQTIKLNEDVELSIFQCQDTVFQLSSIAPGACFELHQHPESQLGMILSGCLEININGSKKMLETLQEFYIAGANIPHGAVNHSPEKAVGLDVKRITNCLASGNIDEVIFKLSPTKDEFTDFPCRSAVGYWCETVITQIPPGGKIPNHESAIEQIGLVVNGQLVMTVGEEQQQLQDGEIYYAPTNVIHGGYNPTKEEATLIKVLILEELSTWI